MPRPKSVRKIAGVPTISGFKPYGLSGSVKRSEAVFLLYEEYEALRLCDYEKYNQQDAALFMGVSRPTLTRICMLAREKIAMAMVEGRKIIIEGGKVELDNEWMYCSSCGCYFVRNEGTETILGCALCGSPNIKPFSSEEMTLQVEGGTRHLYCGRGKCRGRRRQRCGGNEDNF